MLGVSRNVSFDIRNPKHTGAMKKEIAMDAGNLGVADLKQINSSYVSAGANSEVVLTLLIVGVYSLTLSTSTVRGVSRCRVQESR
jgi:hypothetical protein